MDQPEADSPPEDKGQMAAGLAARWNEITPTQHDISVAMEFLKGTGYVVYWSPDAGLWQSATLQAFDTAMLARRAREHRQPEVNTLADALRSMPAPVVNVTLPAKTTKRVQRDAEGLITAVIEE